LNGAAARQVAVGDVVIIMSYCMMDIDASRDFKAVTVFVDEQNQQLKG
ncbi:MAG: aspartate 1-decarboxylase, partial [Bacteroidota bacterium]